MRFGVGEAYQCAQRKTCFLSRCSIPFLRADSTTVRIRRDTQFVDHPLASRFCFLAEAHSTNFFTDHHFVPLEIVSPGGAIMQGQVRELSALTFMPRT